MNNILEQNNEWSGYTLAELQYRRAVILAKKEIHREKLQHSITSILSEDTTPTGIAGNIFGSLVGHKNMLDYLLLGFKLSRKISKVWKRWHNKN